MSIKPAPGREEEVTRWLNAWSSSQDRVAGRRAIEAVYADLERIARCLFGSERSDHTLEPCALVHNLYLELDRGPARQFQDREHFLAVAARSMRHALVDHARGRNRQKRGSGRDGTPIDGVRTMPPAARQHVLAIDDALSDLARHHARQARLVEMRIFGGLTCSEAATFLGISRRTVDRDWRLAKAFLVRAIAT